MTNLLVTIAMADEDRYFEVGPGDVDVYVTEDRYLFVYDYAQRLKLPDNSGLAMVFAPGQWKRVNVHEAPGENT